MKLDDLKSKILADYQTLKQDLADSQKASDEADANLKQAEKNLEGHQQLMEFHGISEE
jgi:hypothetical protein